MVLRFLLCPRVVALARLKFDKFVSCAVIRVRLSEKVQPAVLGLHVYFYRCVLHVILGQQEHRAVSEHVTGLTARLKRVSDPLAERLPTVRVVQVGAVVEVVLLVPFGTVKPERPLRVAEVMAREGDESLVRHS